MYLASFLVCRSGLAIIGLGVLFLKKSTNRTKIKELLNRGWNGVKGLFGKGNPNIPSSGAQSVATSTSASAAASASAATSASAAAVTKTPIKPFFRGSLPNTRLELIDLAQKCGVNTGKLQLFRKDNFEAIKSLKSAIRRAAKKDLSVAEKVQSFIQLCPKG